MRFYLEYINHLGRLQKKSAHRRLQAGFTITEVLLAGVMMLIAVLVSGIGVINLLRSNHRANADSEIRNNLNRTLEFVSDEVRRAANIVENENLIKTTQVPDWEKIKAARAVLAFQIPDPKEPGQRLQDQRGVLQIVYYTTGPENPLTGPRVLWRYGPDLDANGNYITPENSTTWRSSPVTDMLASAAVNPDCPPTDFTRIPANSSSVDGFYTCVRGGGGQVILNANAQVEMTTLTAGTRDKVDYAASTRVSARAINSTSFQLKRPRTFGQGLSATLPLLLVNADVTAKVTGQNACPDCTLAVVGDDFDYSKSNKRIPSKETTTIQGDQGRYIMVVVNPTLTNESWPPDYKVKAYISTDSPIPIDDNQILLEFSKVGEGTLPTQVLLTITAR